MALIHHVSPRDSKQKVNSEMNPYSISYYITFSFNNRTAAAANIYWFPNPAQPLELQDSNVRYLFSYRFAFRTFRASLHSCDSDHSHGNTHTNTNRFHGNCNVLRTTEKPVPSVNGHYRTIDVGFYWWCIVLYSLGIMSIQPGPYHNIK